MPSNKHEIMRPNAPSRFAFRFNLSRKHHFHWRSRREVAEGAGAVAGAGVDARSRRQTGEPVKPVQTKFSKTPGVFMTQCTIYVIEILVDAERREGD